MTGSRVVVLLYSGTMAPKATELDELDTLVCEEATLDLDVDTLDLDVDTLELDVDTLELDLEVDTLELATLLGALEEPPVQQLNCAQAVSIWPPAVVPMVMKYLTTAPAGIALTV